MTASPQQAHSMLSLFELLYKKQYGHRPKINRYRDKWGMIDVISSVGYDRTKELIEYYFKITTRHSLSDFLYSYDSLEENEREQDLDKKHRQKVLAETKKRVEEWEREHRSTGNFRSLPE